MEVLILFCAVVLIFVAALFAFYRVIYRHGKKHHIRHISQLLFSAVSSWYLASYLKELIAFPRPDLSEALFRPLDMYSHGLPSGHAAFMFALATTMYSFDKQAGRALYGLAVLTGIGRVLAGVHFWYDIVGGALLGYVVAQVVVYVCKRLITQH